MSARLDLIAIHLDASDPTFAHGRTEPSCRGEDPELWYANGNSNDFLLAKAICRRCPLRYECANWAIDTGQEYGVWGGLDPDERREERRRRAKAAFIDAVMAGAR